MTRRPLPTRLALVLAATWPVWLTALLTAQGRGSASLAGSAPVEQTAPGVRPALAVLDAFDGLGHDHFTGATPPRNPSDNSLAVGRDHIMQSVNTQIAVFTKRGRQFDTTGRLLFGPVPTHAMFAGHGEVCGGRANGDVVVRYDQLADRWLVVMPIFRRAAARRVGGSDGGPVAAPGEAARPGQAAHPGAPTAPTIPPEPTAPASVTADGSFAMCYAISTGPDPLGFTTPSSVRSFPTIRGRGCGPMATTCRPAPATTSSRSTSVSPTAPGCWLASRPPSSA